MKYEVLNIKDNEVVACFLELDDAISYISLKPTIEQMSLKIVNLKYKKELSEAYPKRFFSYKEGSKASDKEINDWIIECIEYLEVNQHEKFTMQGSGDTIVIMFKFKESFGYNYEVIVCKDYATLDYYTKG